MKTLTLSVVCCVLTFAVSAQYRPDYSVAIGARAGSTGNTCGATIKTFVGDRSALEGILGWYKSGMSGTLLFEQHQTLFRKTEMQLYFGGGVHYTNSTEYQNWTIISSRVKAYEQAGNAYGLDAVIGFEYKFVSIPLAVSVDLKPAIEFNKFKSYSLGIDQGLGLKFAF